MFAVSKRRQYPISRRTDPGRGHRLARGATIAVAAVLVLVAAGSKRYAIRAQPPQGTAPRVEGHLLGYRWVYLQNNFQVIENVARVKAILDRAAAAGFNGVIFPDGKLGRLEDGSLLPRYHTHLDEVLAHARALGMTAMPATADFGYSESILWHDPNLAATLPVRASRHVARGGRLVPDDAVPVRIVNGDFEDVPDSGHAFPGWAWQDQPGVTSFVDRDVRHGGRASIRMEAPGDTNPPAGNARIQQAIAVEPFRHYHVSVWVRTEGFDGGDVRVLLLGQGPQRTLNWNSVPAAVTQDWTRFDVTFNTLTHDTVLFYLGVWGGRGGTIWWDDARIEPAGLFSLARRPGAPVRITSDDGATVYEEGRDVLPLADPKSGNVRWPGDYDLWHVAPPIELAPGSRIADGERVRISWHHIPLIHGEQVTVALNEPAVYDIVETQLASTRRAFERSDAFGGWMLGFDEIRVHGWDEAPAPGDGSPGAALAASIGHVHDLARAIDEHAPLWVWSDMFDPFHNAAERETPYYLVDGDWRGSAQGLDPRIGILNWNRGASRRDSASFFGERGHRQILAGYYDASPNRFADRAWLAELTGIPGIDGVMYTQWGSGFDRLEAWAEHVWGDATWEPWPPEGAATATVPPAATATATVAVTGTGTPVATAPIAPTSAAPTATDAMPGTAEPGGPTHTTLALPWLAR